MLQILVLIILEDFEEYIDSKSVDEVRVNLRIALYQTDQKFKYYSKQNVVELDSQQKLQVLDQLRRFKLAW